jgi:hypothetical protein
MNRRCRAWRRGPVSTVLHFYTIFRWIQKERKNICPKNEVKGKAVYINGRTAFGLPKFPSKVIESANIPRHRARD